MATGRTLISVYGGLAVWRLDNDMRGIATVDASHWFAESVDVRDGLVAVAGGALGLSLYRLR